MNSNNQRQNLYSSAVAFGHFEAKFTAAMGTLLALVLIGFGLYLVIKKTVVTKTVIGEVTNTPNCVLNTQNKNHVYNCSNIIAKYTVNKKTYSENLSTKNSNEYKMGDKITVYYDPSNPAHAQGMSDNTHLFGGLLIVIGLGTLGTVWWYFYLSKTF